MDDRNDRAARLERVLDGKRVEAGSEPPYDYPAYESTKLRAPKKALLLLPQALRDVGGPVFGADAVAELDRDLTRQHAGRAARRAHHRHGPRARRATADPSANTLVEIWQANAAGRYVHQRRPAPGAARSRTSPAPAAA